VIPSRRPPRAKPLVVASVVAVSRHGRWLLLRRPSTGLLGGLWEFPGGKLRRSETPSAAARRELREETGLAAGSLEYLGLFRHEYSHFRVALHLFRTQTARGKSRERGRRQRWVGWTELRRLPLPRATVKMLPSLTHALPGDRASPDSAPRRGRTASGTPRAPTPPPRRAPGSGRTPSGRPLRAPR
jgi:A/G-specific adenine glycosylase